MIGVDGVERAHGVTHNRFTASGLQQWASGSLGSNLALGSGSRSEAASGTALEAFVRSAAGSWSYTNTNVIDSANGVMRSEAILNVTFPAETAPVIYTELGILRDSATSLQTYALIRNLAGLPAALSVLAGEQVRVAYRVQYAIPLLHSSVQTIDGVETTVTVVPLTTGASVTTRLPSVTQSTITGYPAAQGIPTAGTAPGGGTASPRAATVTAGEWKLTLTAAEWALAGGIGMVRAGGGSYVGIMLHFSPSLDKSGASMSLAITTTLTNGDFYGA